MADVELIFPSKKVFIKPFQLVNLIVTIVTALVTGALMLARVGGGGRGGRAEGFWAGSGWVQACSLWGQGCLGSRHIASHSFRQRGQCIPATVLGLQSNAPSNTASNG
jgi:hypothetical protein